MKNKTLIIYRGKNPNQMSIKDKRNNVNELLKFYQKIYPILEPVYIKLVPKIKNSNCVGRTMTVPVGEFMIVGKMRYVNIKPQYIELTQNDKNIIFTLLHEITHGITPHYERKVKEQWIVMDHSDKFYTNFLQIMNIAYENEIIDKKYTLTMLKKEDLK